MQPNNKDFQRAIRYSLKLLSIRRRTIYEIRVKLQEKQFEKPLIRAILDYLIKEKLLDDKEFVREFIDVYQRRKLYGIYRLRHELRRKGISKGDIDAGLKTITFNDEFKWVQKAAQQKIRSYGKTKGKRQSKMTIKEKKRIYDFLIRRGFSYNVVHSIIQDLPC